MTEVWQDGTKQFYRLIRRKGKLASRKRMSAAKGTSFPILNKKIRNCDGLHSVIIEEGVKVMGTGDLGKMYRNGDSIVRQGDAGSSMYVIQDGEVEVVRSHNGKTVRLAVLGQGDIFGELSLFGNDKRSATVRALGDARIITVDKKIFLRRIQEDLTLAFRVFQTMAARLNTMSAELTALKSPVYAD